MAERIRAGRNFLITSHRNPDGDALGSGLALQRLIRQLGKQARVQVRDGFGAALRNIPGADEVAITDTLPHDYPNGFDGVFTMECPEVERTGYPVLPGPVVNIDHHLGNQMYGEINYLDLDAPSVGEMVLQINRNHLKLPLDRETATAMYVSLATDTGFFRYHNTTLRAFEAAEELVRAGVVPGDVSLWINESSPRGAIKLLGLCLTTLEITPDGKTRVSLRAKPGVDVQAVAAMFGGGGHKAASGCTIPLPLSEAKAKLVGLLAQAVHGSRLTVHG